jgi:hypothetical protein
VRCRLRRCAPVHRALESSNQFATMSCRTTLAALIAACSTLAPAGPSCRMPLADFSDAVGRLFCDVQYHSYRRSPPRNWRCRSDISFISLRYRAVGWLRAHRSRPLPTGTSLDLTSLFECGQPNLLPLKPLNPSPPLPPANRRPPPHANRQPPPHDAACGANRDTRDTLTDSNVDDSKRRLSCSLQQDMSTLPKRAALDPPSLHPQIDSRHHD